LWSLHNQLNQKQTLAATGKSQITYVSLMIENNRYLKLSKMLKAPLHQKRPPNRHPHANTLQTINKIVYIGLLGFVIGVLFWFIGLIIAVNTLPHTDATEDILFVVLTTLSFTLGPLVGYLIGKARNFKGPEQYTP
jgi:hypothetical protein